MAGRQLLVPDEPEAVPVSAPSRPRKRWIGRAVRVLVGGGLLAFVLTQVDLAGVGVELSTADVAPYGAALGLAVLAQGLIALNLLWAVRLVGGAMRYSGAVRAHAVGLCANLVLPSTVGGDVVKTVVVRRATGNGIVTAATAVLLARAIGMTGLAINALLGVLLTRDALAAAGLFAPLLALTGGLLAAVVFGWFVRETGGRVALKLAPARLRTKLGPLVGLVASLRLRDVLPAVAIGWVYSLVAVGWFSLIALALSLPLGYGELMMATALVYLLTLLPISIQGVGVREAGYVAILAPLGIAAAPAVAFSLLAFTVPLATGAAGLLVTTFARPDPIHGSSSREEPPAFRSD